MVDVFIPMSSNAIYKQRIIEAVIKEIPERLNPLKNDSIEDLMIVWWMSGRQPGFRLTEIGDHYFRLADIEFYEFEFKIEDIKGYYKFILDLNQKIACPFLLSTDTKIKPTKSFIRFYDSKIAMMLNLYGNLPDYLNSIKVKQNV